MVLFFSLLPFSVERFPRFESRVCFSPLFFIFVFALFFLLLNSRRCFSMFTTFVLFLLLSSVASQRTYRLTFFKVSSWKKKKKKSVFCSSVTSFRFALTFSFPGRRRVDSKVQSVGRGRNCAKKFFGLLPIHFQSQLVFNHSPIG